MSIAKLFQRRDPLKKRQENNNLTSRLLEPTPENRKLLQEYETLVKQINGYPERVAGLRMNYRKREIPARIEALMQEREEKLAQLIAMEKILFPKKP